MCMFHWQNAIIAFTNVISVVICLMCESFFFFFFFLSLWVTFLYYVIKAQKYFEKIIVVELAQLWSLFQPRWKKNQICIYITSNYFSPRFVAWTLKYSSTSGTKMFEKQNQTNKQKQNKIIVGMRLWIRTDNFKLEKFS